MAFRAEYLHRLDWGKEGWVGPSFMIYRTCLGLLFEMIIQGRVQCGSGCARDGWSIANSYSILQNTQIMTLLRQHLPKLPNCGNPHVRRTWRKSHIMRSGLPIAATEYSALSIFFRPAVESVTFALVCFWSIGGSEQDVKVADLSTTALTISRRNAGLREERFAFSAF